MFFPFDTTVVSKGRIVVRTYIFTEHERRLLMGWLAGKQLGNPQSPDQMLDRIRTHEHGLLSDVLLLVRCLRKLRIERKFKRAP